MNIFKKIFGKLKKKNKKEEIKKDEPWFNTASSSYDNATGTPNGEAYISPDSIVVGLSKSNRNG